MTPRSEGVTTFDKTRPAGGTVRSLPAAIVASSVSRQYAGGRWGLRDASIAIPAGLITGLVGPNGAGKSTLMRLFVGFDKPTSGSVGVLGYDPWRQRGEAMRRIGYVPQSPALYRELTVDDHLRLARHYRASFSMESARRRLDQLGIGLRTSVGNLSGGQTAQLALTIAVGTEPEVLLLDEPVANLDPLARADFIAMISKHDGPRPTTVLSSHIVEDIAGSCEYLIILGAGRVLLEGLIRSLLEHHVLATNAPSGNARFIGIVETGGLERGVWETPERVDAEAATLGDLVLAYLKVGRDLRAQGR